MLYQALMKPSQIYINRITEGNCTTVCKNPLQRDLDLSELFSSSFADPQSPEELEELITLVEAPSQVSQNL